MKLGRRTPERRYRFLALAAVACVLGLSTGARVRAQQQPVGDGLAPSAVAQIQALIAEKLSRTPAQRKIDSQLIYAQKMASGKPIADGVATLQVAIPYAADGRVELDVRANVSDGLLDQLRALGAEVVDSDATHHDVRLLAPLGQTEAIAALPEVISVGPKQQATTHGIVGSGPGQIDWNEWVRRRKAQTRLDRDALRARVAAALQTPRPGITVGSVTSQGDTTHKASNARTTFAVDGTGVKVGVLSDGVTNLAAAQASGDLGSVTVAPGQTGSGDEGTAMLEIVHDLAPGAQLFFETGFTGITNFANNIRDLRNTYGCDIIIDDIGYFDESPFQDGQTGAVVSTFNQGVVTQAVKDVVAAGALYFSSAANSGNLDAGTSGTWEGDFVTGAPNSALCTACETHTFGGGQNFDVITTSGTGVHTISLDWSDPLGGSGNDYDLYLTNNLGNTVIASSTGFQTGTQDPHEIFQLSGSILNDRIYIVRFSAPSGRFFHLDTNRDRLSIATTGSTHAHAATTATNSFGVAATPAVGPYPSPFNSGNVVETFSSDGPRRIFFNGDGTAITPGNFSATGGQLLQKPDFTAADGVSVSGAGGFGSAPGSCGAVSGRCFFGTSAAAPHAGAIAALVKSKNLALTPTQVRTALFASLIDIQAAGWDRDSGSGILMADTAVGSVIVPPPSITSQPSNQTIAYNTTATLSVTASGASLSYQWYQGASGDTTTPQVGATSSSFTTPAMISDRKFWVRVTNGGGSTNSNAALVTVNFTDPTLVVGTTTVNKVHWDEIAARINAEQTRDLVATTSFRTLTAGVTTILLQDYTDRRQAIVGVWSVVFGGSPTFNSNPVAGSVISATEVNDLRSLLHTLESR